jgi:hypothetical protein
MDGKISWLIVVLGACIKEPYNLYEQCINVARVILFMRTTYSYSLKNALSFCFVTVFG